MARGAEVLEEMKAAGVTVTEIDREAFKALTEPVYAELGLAEAREALRPAIEASRP